MSVHTLSVCPGDQHSFWFTGGIFKESAIVIMIEMSVHTLSVCPGDQHSFWFTGGIFKESSPYEGRPLLLEFSPVSSPSRPDFVMHRVDLVDMWFLGFLVGRVAMQEGFPSLVS